MNLDLHKGAIRFLIMCMVPVCLMWFSPAFAQEKDWEYYYFLGVRAAEEDKKYDEAEALLKRALSMAEASGKEDPRLVRSLLALGKVHQAQKKYVEAERELVRALKVSEGIYSPVTPETARALDALGQLYFDMEQFAKAEDLFKQALDTLNSWLNGRAFLTSPVLAVSKEDIDRHLLDTLYVQGKDAEAKRLLLKRGRLYGVKGGPEASNRGQGPEVFWNTWAHERTSRAPLPRLKTDHTYSLTLHLSSISYATKDQDGAYVRVADTPFRIHADDWLKEEEDDIPLEVYVLPNIQYFQKPSRFKNDLFLNRKKLKQLAEPMERPPEVLDAFKLLLENEDQEFVLGKASFDLATRKKEGLAVVGFSLWKDNRPVEDLSMLVCIADSEEKAKAVCKQNRVVDYGLSGIDSFRSAGKDAVPDASFYLFGLDRDDLVTGFFRWKEEQGQTALYREVTWNLEGKPQAFHQELENLIKGFKQVGEANFSLRGDALYDLLVPPEQTEARKAIEDFVRARAAANPPASIFVRMIEPGEILSLFVPIGLMKVQDRFLGLHFRIEAPLPSQDYATPSGCLGRWVVAYPKTDGEVQRVIGRFPSLETWKEASETFFTSTIDEFGTWLNANAAEVDPTALLVVTHHSANELSFSSSGPGIDSKIVRRQFKPVSVVILNGCGTTAKAGSGGFIRQFNRQGIGTVIATNAEVRGDMAGQFLACLEKLLDDKTPLSMAFFRALKCLEKTEFGEPSPSDGKRQQYGNRVLVYSLLGNGNLKLCPPKKPGSN